MAIRSIKKFEVTCDTCKKTLATGSTSENLLRMFEDEQRFTEMFCTDCHKPPEVDPTLLSA